MKNSDGYYRKNVWPILLVTLAIVIVSVWTFGAVEYFANVVLGMNRNYQPIIMIGMIVPMSMIVGTITYVILRKATHYTLLLIAGMRKVASGDFTVRLDEEVSGFYKDAFADFNTMCDELKNVQTIRDDFINNFSHEFRTPITSISGFIGLLQNGNVPEPKRVQYLEIIARECDRLTEMSSNVLMLTKIESQHFVLDRIPYPLDEQLKRCAILLSPQWMKKGIDFSADFEPASYEGNEELMRHVWINLLGNAIKFTPERGRVSATLQVEGGELVATIADTGKGMTEDELAHAFDKFYQGKSADALRGLGLGLAIVKRIVELCGGHIEARSIVGKGSTFTVYLPRIAPR